MTSLRIVSQDAPDLGAADWSATWPSRAEEVPKRVAELVAEITAHGPVEGEDEAWLRLCLDEVVINAVIHGNDADPILKVDAFLWFRDGGWSLKLADRGEGFTLEQVPDPRDPSSLTLEHGRGIRIMLDWLDELTYYRGGSIAFLHRRYIHAHL